MGRANHVNGLFLKFAQRDFRSEAFQALSPWARLAIFELDMTYWEGPRENPIVLTQRWLASRLHIDAKTAAKVIDELEGHWFLELERMGRTTGPLGQRGARYIMNWLPTSDGRPATFANRNWKASPGAKNAEKLGASTPTIRAIDEAEKGLQRTSFRAVQNVSAELMLQLQTAGPRRARGARPNG